jgi:CheY-like chemotaxis protein
MVSAKLKSGTGTELKALLEPVVDVIGETLSSLVGREIKVQRTELLVQDPESLRMSLPRESAVARGAMDKDYEGKSLLTILEVPDAISMAGLLMMTPEDVIIERRKSKALDGEDVEAFGELGNVLYSGIANILREKVENFDLRMQDQGNVQPGADKDGILGTERLVTFGFQLKVGEFPESTGLIAVDLETAAKWNKGPLELDGEGSDPEADLSVLRNEDEGLDNIPEAPIRGILATFIEQGDIHRMLRRSCRRVGLELHRHGRGEVPNPASHHNQIVVLDVPATEERRFDWCRRIKELSPTTKVVLLIHHASRHRVTQAFLAHADAILGFPCDEAQLSQKLEQITPELETSEASPDDADSTQ